MKRINLLIVLLLPGYFSDAQTNYYSKSAGNLNLVATWGINPDGSGASPANFTTANHIFNIVNNASPAISANWTVSGAGSMIKVGDGIQVINFTITSPRTVTATFSVMVNSTLTTASGATLNGTINVAGTFINQAVTNPVLGVLSAGSTVNYAASANQTVLDATYSNLTLSGTGIKSLANAANATVNNTLNINTGVSFKLETSTGITTILNGTITGAGTITGSNTSNLTIGGTGNFGIMKFTAGGQSVRNFTVNRAGGGSIQLGTALTVARNFTHTNGVLDLNGQILTLNRRITFPATIANGSFTGSSTSSLIIGGSNSITNSLLMTQTNASTQTLNNLTLNRAGLILTLGNNLNIVGTVSPTAGTIASNGNLVLIATSPSVTARIGQIGAGANVTGNITVQSDEKGGQTGWTLMGVAGVTGRTFADWNTSFVITCPTCPNGSTVGGNPFTSIYSYNEPTGGVFSNPARYIALSNINNPLNPGIGYWVYLGNSTTTTTDIITNVTGPVNMGNFNFNLTMTNAGGGTNAVDHGYNLIANPYPSPIQWSLLRNGNANVANAIYVYNPDLAGYASYVNGISNPAVGAGGIGNFIAAGQGFFVKANAATTITAAETNKGASNQLLLRQQNNTQTVNTNPVLFRLTADGNNQHNETAVYFDPSATTSFDNDYDANYMAPDAGILGIATSLNGTDYAINGLPPLIQNISVPLKVNAGTSGNYLVAANGLQNLPAGACIILHDNYTSLNQDLRLGSYAYAIMDTEKVARFVVNIQINNTLQVTGTLNNPICKLSANGSIIATPTGSSGPWNYSWKDASNNVLRSTLNKTSSDTFPNLNAGNYSVDINTSGTCDNGTGSFILQSSSSVISSFNPSASSAILSNDTAGISFANTSNNANDFWWDFGDGTGSNDTNTTHLFGSPGDFTVTLFAINANCNDTSFSSQVVTIIDSLAATVVPSFSPGKNTMIISRDQEGYYVKFNYLNPTSAQIVVQNMLGETVTPGFKRENVLNDKIYIPIGNNNDHILILSVVTGDGQKVYCKILNY